MKYDVNKIKDTLGKHLQYLKTLEESGEYSEKGFSRLDLLDKHLVERGYTRELVTHRDRWFASMFNSGVLDMGDPVLINSDISRLSSFLYKLDFLYTLEGHIDEKELPGEVNKLLLSGVKDKPYMKTKPVLEDILKAVEDSIESGYLRVSFPAYEDCYYKVNPIEKEVVEEKKEEVEQCEIVEIVEVEDIGTATARDGIIFFCVGVFLAIAAFAFF